MKVESLAYHRDSAALYAPMAREPWGIFLDSAGTGTDVLACGPRLRLYSAHGAHLLQDALGRTLEQSDDPFALLRRALTPPPGGGVTTAGFPGGALGYLGYDLGRCTEPFETRLQPGLSLPEAAVGIYDWAVVVEHPERRCRLIMQEDAGPSETLRERLHDAARKPVGAAPPAPEVSEISEAPEASAGAGFRPEMDRARYERAFERIRRYIRDGDCYQVNLAVRFRHPCETDPWELYTRLRRLKPRAAFRLHAPARQYGRTVLFAGTLPARTGSARRDLPDQGHPATRRRPRARCRPGAGVAAERQGPRREPDDRGPAAQ